MGVGIEAKQSIAVVTASPNVNLSWVKDIEFQKRLLKEQSLRVFQTIVLYTTAVCPIRLSGITLNCGPAGFGVSRTLHW